MTELQDTTGGIDPVTFQIIKHRLFQVTDEAVTALKRTSGAPNTTEGHDLISALYTKDGGLLTGGFGYHHAYTGASQATKHIMEKFEGNINEGDMFLLNDPYTAALHAPDAYIISPVFYEGELRAWSATFVHVIDIGAVDPGGFSPHSTSVYHEGFQTPGIKFVEDGDVRQDVLDTFLNMSRDPEIVELDMRSQVAANNVAEERMCDLFDEYGTEKVETVSEALIDQSEEKLKQRLRELPDGQWEARQYMDSPVEDETYKIKLTLTKEGDSLTFDFEGTSGQSEYGLNCAYWAAEGGVFAPLFPLMCHDITWNDGVINVVDVEAPEGTIVNAERPAPISLATTHSIHVCNNLSTLLCSKLLGSTDESKERSTAIWHGTHCQIMLQDRTGDQTMVKQLTDTMAGAGGGRSFDDGVDIGGETANVVTRWGNVERHESEIPLIYLYRRSVEDSGGAGKYRGGVGHEYAVVPVDPDSFDEIDLVTFGRGIEVPQPLGIFGGYPGGTVDYSIFRDIDLQEYLSTFSPPDTDPDSVEREDARWGVFDLAVDDMFRIRFGGSGGYGDPLERDADDVAADVKQGKIDVETARTVYGVPVTEEGSFDGSVDETRDRLYSERLEDADSHEQPIAYADTEPTGFMIGEYVTVVVDKTSGDKYAACRSCETTFASVEDNWKESVVVSEAPVSAAGRHRDTPDNYCLREFVCPECGTLLDTEVADRDDPPLLNTVV